MLRLVVLQLVLARATSSPPPPDSISLNGAWEFELDTTDTGLQQGFQRRPSFSHTIQIPGISIGAAGFGSSTAQKHHEYTGISWFAKNVTLPPGWAGGDAAATVSLACGGVKNSAWFWLDGVAIGNHSGYMDGFELPLRNFHDLSYFPPSYNPVPLGRIVLKNSGPTKIRSATTPRRCGHLDAPDGAARRRALLQLHRCTVRFCAHLPHVHFDTLYHSLFRSKMVASGAAVFASTR